MALLLHRLRDDDGISLVEILVSIVVGTIALTAFASTLVQTLNVVSRDEQLVRGNQLAADVLEGMRSLRWEDLGFYTGDSGYSSFASDGAETVVLGPTRPAGSNAPTPQRVIDRDGIQYSATLEVVWQDDPNEPAPPATETDPKDFKELRVRLDWSVRGTPFTAESVSIRQPTIEEVPLEPVAACTPGEITAFDVSPDFVLVSASGITLDDITVTVSTCGPVSQVVLHPDPLAAFSMTANSASGNTFFTIDPFRAGATSFDTTTYTWTATPNGGTPVTADVQFVEQGTALLQVVSLETSAGGVVCIDGTTTDGATTLTARITGAGADDIVQISWTSNNGSASGAFSTIDANGRGVFQATVPAGHTFTAASTTVVVQVSRSSDGLSVTESYDIPVIQRGEAGCPSA